MNSNTRNQSEINQVIVELLGNDEILLKKIIRIAQFESEVDFGVNPTSKNQANTGNLSEQDFEYINRVCTLVEKRLMDSKWLIKTIDYIENKPAVSGKSVRGVKFDDELFKAGRGILEAFLNENK